MAKRMRLTEENELDLLFLNSDKKVSDKEEKMEFEPDMLEDLNESCEEYLSLDEEEIDVGNLSNDNERDVNVNVFSVTGGV